MNLTLILLQAAPRQQTGATNYSGILMLLIIGFIIYYFVKVRTNNNSTTPNITESVIKSDLKWHQKPIATILFLIFFFPVGLYLMWKNEIWTKQSRWVITSIFLILIVVNLNKSNNYNSDSNSNSNSSSSNNNNASLEVSKNAYRYGYADGQMGYGLPASERATAFESYMAHDYNFSRADILVYEMGYNDAIYGRSAQY